MLITLLPFRILSVLMMTIGILSAVVIIVAPFADQLIIPDVLIEWGLNLGNLANSFVLWLLFFFIFGSGSTLLYYSTDKERRSEILMLSSGILILIGFATGICLLLNQSGILNTKSVSSLWVILAITYLLGLLGIRRTSPKIDELIKKKKDTLRQKKTQEKESKQNLGDTSDQEPEYQ